MDQTVKGIQRLITRRFRELGRLYVVTSEILTVTGIENFEQRKIPPHRLGVMEDPHSADGDFRTLFVLNEPYRCFVSLISRGNYKIFGEGDLSQKQRDKIAEVEHDLNIRIFDKHEDDRTLSEIFPHEFRPYEGHPIIIYHKSGIFSGVVAVRPFGAGLYIQIERDNATKIFGLGNFIGGSVLIHDTIYRLTEHRVK